MAKLTADFLLERLAENGVKRIYGYPGDGINAIIGALERHKDKLKFVQVRHEEQAAFMACAHAKWTGEVGVCLATSGPGAIHLLNGLYDAKLDHQPVLAIVGQQSRMGLGGNYQQEVDLVTLFKDVAHEYVQMAYEPTQIRHLVDRAHRIALDQRTVTAHVIPNDLVEEPAVEEPPREHGAVVSAPGYARPRVVPSEGQLQQAAEILNAGEKVAMLVGRMLSIRYPMECAVVGDAKETLKALTPMLQRKEDRGWREQIEQEIQEWWRLLEERAMQEADPINPQRLFWELNEHLPEDAIVSSDSGSAANWYARDLKLGPTHLASLSGTLATMGPGVPYAIAAKFCHPNRPAVALVGDGAMQMSGMAELITAQKYYKEWADPRLVVLVLNNRDLNQVTWEQRALQGDPMNPMTQRIPDVRYGEFAELIGLRGVRIEQPEDIGDAWRQAFEADRPFVIDAVCDPNVPPLPPHIRTDQARASMKALRKGDPEARGVITQSFKQKILEFLPGR